MDFSISEPQRPRGDTKASYEGPRGPGHPGRPRHANDPGTDADRPPGHRRAPQEPRDRRQVHETPGVRPNLSGLQVKKTAPFLRGKKVNNRKKKTEVI